MPFKRTQMLSIRLSYLSLHKVQPRYVLLSGLAILVGLLLLLPPVYIFVRAAESIPDAIKVLTKVGTFWTLLRTISLSLTVTLFAALISIPLAWLTTRTNLPGRRIWAVLLALPLVIPSYVGAYLFVSVFGPYGMVQGWLEPLGIERLPDVHSFWGTVLVLTLMSYPYILLSTRNALNKTDPALEEAARSLGYTPFETFRQIVLPLIRPGIVAGALLVALYVLRDFGAVSVMRYNTFTRVIYIQYQSFLSRSLAAALAIPLILMTLALVIFELRLRRQHEQTHKESGAQRPPPQHALGVWKWPALLFCGLIVFLALGVPAGGLSFWLIRGVLSGEVISDLWAALLNTMLAGSGAAMLTLVSALIVAQLMVQRRRTWLAKSLEHIVYIGFALPGIVVALALVFFGARYSRLLYQSLPMLLIAYMILYIPQAVGTLRTSLLQVRKSLNEASRSLGNSPLRTFFKVTFPLIRSGLFAGGALVFLTVVKELPATLLLSPFEFPTLATLVWANVSEAFFAKAAAPALLLILLSSIPMAILTFREQT